MYLAASLVGSARTAAPEGAEHSGRPGRGRSRPSAASLRTPGSRACSRRPRSAPQRPVREIAARSASTSPRAAASEGPRSNPAACGGDGFEGLGRPAERQVGIGARMRPAGSSGRGEREPRLADGGSSANARSPRRMSEQAAEEVGGEERRERRERRAGRARCRSGDSRRAPVQSRRPELVRPRARAAAMTRRTSRGGKAASGVREPEASVSGGAAGSVASSSAVGVTRPKYGGVLRSGVQGHDPQRDRLPLGRRSTISFSRFLSSGVVVKVAHEHDRACRRWPWINEVAGRASRPGRDRGAGR